MASQPLSVIVKIKPGEENALKQILEEIGANLADNPYLRLTKSSLTHFARFGIMNDPDNGYRLLFTSNYDGTLENYLDELFAIGPGIEQIWNKCEGYRGRQEFGDFIQEHSYKAQTVYIALRDETVESIRQKISLRQQLEKFLDLNDVSKFLDFPGVKPFLEGLSQLPQRLPWWKKLASINFKLWQQLGDGVNGLIDRLRQLLLSILRFIGRTILGAPDRQRQIGEYTGVRIDNERLRELNEAEVINGQNHLHLLSTVKQGRLLRLKLVLFLINAAAKFLFPVGTLANIQSIHFAHWAILDNGKRLLFVTHYDGSFDNYLGDFSDRASDGLNSIWNNVEGYPQAGGQDVVAFKQFFRNDQQPPSLVFYRAYPEATVKTLLRDRAIVNTLSENFERKATEDWLELL